MATRSQSDPLIDGGGRIQRLLGEARKFSQKTPAVPRPGPVRPTLANPSRPFTPREDVRSFYPAMSSLNRMRTPSNLGITLSPLNQSFGSSVELKQMLATPHSTSPLRRGFAEETLAGLTVGMEADDPVWLQIQGLLPLLDSGLSEETILSALDTLLQIAQNLMGQLRPAKDGGTEAAMDKRLRPAISRLEKLQAKASSPFIQIKAAEIILLAAPEGLFYPSQCYQLYKLSKDPNNDVYFRQTGIVPVLLGLLQALGETEVGAITLAAAALSHVLEDSIICKTVAKDLNGITILKQVLLKVVDALLCGGGNQEKNVNFAIQITSCLRHLSESVKNVRRFAEVGVMPVLLKILRSLAQYKDLVLNVSRILAKVSLQHECRSCINNGPDDVENLQAIIGALDTYCTIPAIADRLAFTLGNLTHTTDNNRVLVIRKLNALPIITKVLISQLRADSQINAAEATFESPVGSAEETDRTPQKLTPKEEVEGALTRILRVVGNLAINAEVGAELSSSEDIATALTNILTRKSVLESEELVLNAVSCLTNLSFYESPSNKILQRQEEVLKPLALLTLHDHNEVVHESVQAFGNFSRRFETRSWMIEKRIDEALVILLDHSEPSIVTAVTGVLMNFSADGDHNQMFNHFGALDKLLEWMDDFNEQGAENCLEAVDRIVKIFCNLLETGFFKEGSRVVAVRDQLLLLSNNLRTVEGSGSSVQLADITHQALQLIGDRWPKLSLPQCVDQATDLEEI